MAEYWKSAPRHWCKQCKIFIRDTAFEKTQHEASPKHQGNLKRFLRDIHKNNENQQRETQRAKSEVERLRQAISGGASESKTDSKTPAPAPTKQSAAPAERPVSVEDRKKQMAQLVEMGVAIPQEYRAEMALAGEWQTLSVTNLDSEGAKSIGVRKRKLEGEEDEEIPEYVSKGWGSRMKIYPGVQDEDDGDLDALLASTKDLKKAKTETPAIQAEEVKEETGTLPKTKDENTDSKSSIAPVSEEGSSAPVKAEEADDSSVPPVSAAPPSDEGSGVVFKKRKSKVMRK
ncbi:uncharacterized protein N7483_011663 [Penicillium malachiteum]|uniref:uncharacterized protein n=1 Tax=Penicillium malachiteum TaxID=1324776 RepID=UPI002549614F|nr:uncharacterized protein N7483_011663 [Penicillium malachiteum]KAJ5714482.1 hypothetical protein N7483_011663 [Penicillium malachiteum]